MLKLRPEPTITCEWDTFLEGEPCGNASENVIIDTNETSDPDYPEGLHVAHLCDEHAKRGLCAMQPEPAP